ncbi:MAG TPA: ABC transporter substrate-binding protein [Streptosporangiaceae bacterium]|jgi:peptide/nickel transport system substrate-binding protein|nr:ABC transporter substrate-binding protein [Streptosporangiaceae bacterium]
MKRPGALLSAAGLALALGAAACSSGGAPSSPSGSGSAAPTGPVNRTFTYATTAPVMDDGWDPATEYSDGIIAMSNMYETLTRYDPATHKVGPLLATSWSSSKNGLTWTFHLRQGVKFHTGRPMTAQAAKAAIERTIKLAGGAAYVWDAVKSISTPDTGTLVFHLKYPSPLDLQASADYSAYIYDTKAAGSGSLAKWLNTPHDAGTGPYTVQTWNKGQEFEVTQTQFPGYWGGWTGSHFTKVVFRVVPQDTTSVQLLRSGQVSFVEQMAPALWESLRGAPGISLVSSPSWQNLLGQLNAKTLSLPERQAILYGINYNGIVAALKGAATLSSGLVPDGLFGHFSSASLPNYSYDPAKAAQLLNSQGYGPGKKPLNLSLTYTQGDSNEQVVATLMKSSLAKLNINLSIQSLAWPTQWGKAKSANPAQHQDIFFEYWWPDYADPYSWFVNLLETEKQPYFNLSYYSNPSLDKQINKVETLVATDRTAGQALYKSMQTTILRQAPLTVLYNDTYQYAMSSGFSGFKVNPAYPNVVFAYDLTPTGS